MDCILEKCVDPLLSPLRNYLLKHFLYAVRVGDNVEKLNDLAGDLTAKRKSVLDEIEQKERSTAQKRTEEVEHWLNKVATTLASSHEIQRDYDNINCMLGTCCSNYSIGKRAFNKQVEIGLVMVQINQITNYTCEMVPPNVQRMNTTTEYVPTSQLEFFREKALSFIKEEEDTHGVLGIWGMGGVGKTTLLKHINNSVEVNEFQCIFVVASQGCTKRKLQELIADQLKLSKDDDLFRNILNCLDNKDFVLFVDDLWEHLSLNDVGIPYPLGVCNGFKRKVILTTRFKNVCGNMGTGSNIINVECLKWDEARALFEKNVGQGVIINSTNSPIGTLAKKVAQECCGHPLTLITVGRAMSQNETVGMWEDALEKLRASRMYDIPYIQGMGEHSHTLSLLSVSYDYLKTGRLKECFLLCALWPEDFPIDHDELIRCWMGHGLLDGFDNISQVYIEGKVVIDTLLKACLLEEYKDKNTILPCVKMHDLTRDMALWVARERGVNKKKWLVFTDIDDDSEMVNITPETDKVSIFFNHKMVNITPETDKVSILISRSWLHVTTLTVSGFLRDGDLANLQYCSSLRYLDVSGNYCIKVIPAELCNLNKLEYLDLRLTFVQVFPWEMKNLTNLKYLFLEDVGGIDDGVLSNLTSLLVLDMKRNNEDVSSVVLDELECSGRQLKALGITMRTPSSIEKLARLPNTTLTSLGIKEMRECSTIPLLSDHFLGRPHMHSHLKTLEIMCCDSLKEVVMMQGRRSSCRLTEIQQLKLTLLEVLKEIVWRGVEPVDVFPKLREIDIFCCNKLEHVSWAAHLPCLEILYISHCNKLSHVVVLREQVGEADRPPTTIFPTLQRLVLNRMESLINICEQEIAFQSLEYLEVDACEQLKKLPFLSSASSCGKLKRIKAVTEWWDNLELDPKIRTSFQPLLF